MAPELTTVTPSLRFFLSSGQIGHACPQVAKRDPRFSRGRRPRPRATTRSSSPLFLRPPTHPIPDTSLGAFRRRAVALATPSAPHLHRYLRWLLADAPASCTSGQSTPSTPRTRRSTRSTSSIQCRTSRTWSTPTRWSRYARGVSSSSTTKDPHCPPPACSRGSPLCWAQHEHPKQIISIHNQWNCYKAPEEGEAKRERSQQLFLVRKCSVLQNNREAEVNYVLVCGVLLVVLLFEHFWRMLKWFSMAHHGRQHTHAHRRR
ncbi:uncharacterized protein [Triticum aestivum]|uniref:uncharacterized protein isoform X2 n=1 Tax=Triticum aestivum TaxID=4565 RepID=UPI001D01EFDF|nr:uncharacterized protein LOC123162373 isoform X2 [Triticum aestivum]